MDHFDSLKETSMIYHTCYCQGHPVKEYYCTAKCLDCGDMYCHCVGWHCCCPEPEPEPTTEDATGTQIDTQDDK